MMKRSAPPVVENKDAWLSMMLTSERKQVYRAAQIEEDMTSLTLWVLTQLDRRVEELFGARARTRLGPLLPSPRGRRHGQRALVEQMARRLKRNARRAGIGGADRAPGEAEWDLT